MENIANIPVELRGEIVSYLSARDELSLALICRDMLPKHGVVTSHLLCAIENDGKPFSIYRGDTLISIHGKKIVKESFTSVGLEEMKGSILDCDYTGRIMFKKGGSTYLVWVQSGMSRSAVMYSYLENCLSIRTYSIEEIQFCKLISMVVGRRDRSLKLDNKLGANIHEEIKYLPHDTVSDKIISILEKKHNESQQAVISGGLDFK